MIKFDGSHSETGFSGLRVNQGKVAGESRQSRSRDGAAMCPQRDGRAEVVHVVLAEPLARYLGCQYVYATARSSSRPWASTAITNASRCRSIAWAASSALPS
jgi:hypothetical protein